MCADRSVKFNILLRDKPVVVVVVVRRMNATPHHHHHHHRPESTKHGSPTLSQKSSIQHKFRISRAVLNISLSLEELSPVLSIQVSIKLGHFLICSSGFAFYIYGSPLALDCDPSLSLSFLCVILSLPSLLP